MRFPWAATSERAPQLDRNAARQLLFKRVLLGLGVLCLVTLGVIGAVIGNSASRFDPDSVRATIGPVGLTDWHGVPVHPDAKLLRDISVDSSEFSASGDAATIGDWFEREWTGIGLHYVETVTRDGMMVRWFEVTAGITRDPVTGFRTSSHIFGFRRFGYAVTVTSPGRCTITLIRAN